MANDLQELGQLLQLSNLSQQPGLEQQRLQQQQKAGNIQALLSMLGLQQQQQQGQARLGFDREQLGQTTTHQTAQDQLAQSNIQKAYDLQVAKDVATGTQGGQKLSPVAQALYEGMSPIFKESNQQQYWKDSTDQYNNGQAGYNAVYDKHDPAALAAYAKLQGYTPDASTWLGQNAENRPPVVHAPGLIQQMFQGATSNAPMIGTEQREGGVLPYLKQTGVIPTLPTPEERAARSQSLWDAPDSPLSILFGRKKTTTPAQ